MTDDTRKYIDPAEESIETLSKAIRDAITSLSEPLAVDWRRRNSIVTAIIRQAEPLVRSMRETASEIKTREAASTPRLVASVIFVIGLALFGLVSGTWQMLGAILAISAAAWHASRAFDDRAFRQAQNDQVRYLDNLLFHWDMAGASEASFRRLEIVLRKTGRIDFEAIGFRKLWCDMQEEILSAVIGEPVFMGGSLVLRGDEWNNDLR